MAQINRVEDLIKNPYTLLDLEGLAAIDGDWMEIETRDTIGESGHREYRCNVLTDLIPNSILWEDFVLFKVTMDTEHLLCGLAALSRWLKNPRLVRPTQEQEDSFANVSFSLAVEDFSTPFSAMVVETPSNRLYKAALVCEYHPGTLILYSFGRDGEDDSGITLGSLDGGRNSIESLLTDGSEQYQSTAADFVASQRVALNMCLALSNWGCKESPLLPKQLAEDRRFAREDSERGRKARVRVRRALTRVEFTREIVVRRPSPPAGPSEPTGREIHSHWVRGHWKCQPFGPARAGRKKIFIRPYLTRIDQRQAGLEPLVAYRDAR